MAGRCWCWASRIVLRPATRLWGAGFQQQAGSLHIASAKDIRCAASQHMGFAKRWSGRQDLVLAHQIELPVGDRGPCPSRSLGGSAEPTRPMKFPDPSFLARREKGPNISAAWPGSGCGVAWPRELSRDTPGASAFSERGLNSKRNPNPEPQRRQQDEDFRQDLLPAATYHLWRYESQSSISTDCRAFHHAKQSRRGRGHPACSDGCQPFCLVSVCLLMMAPGARTAFPLFPLFCWLARKPDPTPLSPPPPRALFLTSP